MTSGAATLVACVARELHLTAVLSQPRHGRFGGGAGHHALVGAGQAGWLLEGVGRGSYGRSWLKSLRTQFLRLRTIGISGDGSLFSGHLTSQNLNAKLLSSCSFWRSRDLLDPSHRVVVPLDVVPSHPERLSRLTPAPCSTVEWPSVTPWHCKARSAWQVPLGAASAGGPWEPRTMRPPVGHERREARRSGWVGGSGATVYTVDLQDVGTIMVGV